MPKFGTETVKILAGERKAGSFGSGNMWRYECFRHQEIIRTSTDVAKKKPANSGRLSVPRFREAEF